jgi:RNA-directed DNA polymerase
MEEICEWENCRQAYKRVKANKGSPGIDGMKVGDLSGYLKYTGPRYKNSGHVNTASCHSCIPP